MLNTKAVHAQLSAVIAACGFDVQVLPLLFIRQVFEHQLNDVTDILSARVTLTTWRKALENNQSSSYHGIPVFDNYKTYFVILSIGRDVDLILGNRVLNVWYQYNKHYPKNNEKG